MWDAWQVLRVARLARPAAVRLVEQLMGARAKAEDVARVVERGAGNPWLLERIGREAGAG